MTPRSLTPDPVSSAPAPRERPPDKSPPSPTPLTAGTDEHFKRRHPDVNSETGRIRPISAEEWRDRQEELTRRFEEIDAKDETPDEVYDEFMRNLDEERRRQGRPPAFDGCYST
jgi:hypothetical protein